MGESWYLMIGSHDIKVYSIVYSVCPRFIIAYIILIIHLKIEAAYWNVNCYLWVALNFGWHLLGLLGLVNFP